MLPSIQLFRRCLPEDNDGTKIDSKGNQWVEVDNGIMRFTDGTCGTRAGDVVAVPVSPIVDQLGCKRKIIVVMLKIPNMNLLFQVGTSYVVSIDILPDDNYLVTYKDGTRTGYRSKGAILKWKYASE